MTKDEGDKSLNEKTQPEDTEEDTTKNSEILRNKLNDARKTKSKDDMVCK